MRTELDMTCCELLISVGRAMSHRRFWRNAARHPFGFLSLVVRLVVFLVVFEPLALAQNRRVRRWLPAVAPIIAFGGLALGLPIVPVVGLATGFAMVSAIVAIADIARY